MTEDSDKVLKNYQLALAEFGRPVGPFEAGRERTYNAVASAKRGPEGRPAASRAAIATG